MTSRETKTYSNTNTIGILDEQGWLPLCLLGVLVLLSVVIGNNVVWAGNNNLGISFNQKSIRSSYKLVSIVTLTSNAAYVLFAMLYWGQFVSSGPFTSLCKTQAD